MLISLLCAVTAPAFAASNEVSIEAGWLGAHDPAWDLFDRSNTLVSGGVRVGFAVHPNVAIIAGWQRSVSSAKIRVEDGEDRDSSYQDVNFRTAMYSDQISVGSKADVKLVEWLHPYVTAQVVGMRGLARLDDQAEDDQNLTQLQRAGLTWGFLAGGGLDFLIPVKGKVAIAPYVEFGYGWLAPMVFPDLGSVQFSGFAGRAGVGVRF